LSQFENLLSEPNEGITMNKISKKVASRAAVAATLSLGMTIGAVGVASASPVSHHRESHSGHKWGQSQNWLKGIVSAYVPGTSISITAKDATTPTMYTLTSATTITGLATGATLAVGNQVNVVLSTTTPVTVTSINVETPRPVRLEAVVSTYTAGSSITVLVDGSTTPATYALTSATTVTGLATGAVLASPTDVDLVLSSTTPTTVTSIVVEANGEGNCHGHAHPGFTTSSFSHGGFGRHGSHGFGSSNYGGARR
jgi:hypothetical protein